MTHRRKQLIAAIFFVTLATAAPRLGQSSPGQVALEAAKKKEVVDGDLEGAIKLYKEIVSKYAKQRPIAAAALVRMADAYRKLGDLESRKIYEQVIRDYPDQKSEATQARASLDASLVSVYSASVTPSEARFVFPFSPRERWEWYRASTAKGTLEYKWGVGLEEAGYGFGYFLFKPRDATPAHGNIDALLIAGQKSVVKADQAKESFSLIPIPLSVRAVADRLIISIKSPEDLRMLFSGRPRVAEFATKLPGEPEIRHQIPITYSEK